MYDSKLLELLKVLGAGELKRLYQFLKSPFYNANPRIVELYLLLRSDHPDFTAPRLSRERVFQRLFPSRSYDHQKLLNLMSDFTTLLKKYLQTIQLEKEEWVQDRLLIQAYAARPHCYDRFVKQVRKTERRLDAQPYRDTDYYRQKFWLGQQYVNHPVTDKFTLSKGHYDASMEQLDRWFLLEKLLLSCEMKAREKPLSEDYDIWLLPEIRERIAHYPAEDTITGAYLEMLRLLESGEETSYYQLKGLLLENLPQFTRLQQQNILQSLINYAIRQGNQGKKDFLKENLELYQFGLQEDLFLENGTMNDMVFISMVNIALRTGESEWCIQFIHDYTPYLGPPARKDAQSLAMALWLYAVQKPEAIMDLLLRVDFRNVYYQIQARVLLLKVYFEAFRQDDDYLELTLSQTKSFQRYLMRNKQVSKTQKEALLNFSLWVNRLAKLKSGNQLDRQLRAKIRSEIEAMSALYNKSWLLQQVE